MVREPFGVAPDPAVAAVFDRTAGLIRSAVGTELTEVAALAGPPPRDVFEAMWVTGRGLGFADLIRRHGDVMDPGLTRLLPLAERYSLADKLGNGIARLPEMLAAGLNVGLGHDAAECNNSLDMFEVMKFASLMHRAARVDASLQQAPDVLWMATRNGAAALGHETGQLSAGRKADVTLVDTRNVMFTPLVPGNAEQLYSHLVFAANGSAVDTTIVDGRVLMRGRQLLTLDEQEILRQANAAFQRVLARI